MPPVRHRRSDAERRDQLLSWARPDRAFFAAGACHILAWEFLRRHTAGYIPVALRVIGEPHANHVYVSDGCWAFDSCGWTRESELLAVTQAALSTERPGALIERMMVDVDLASFCTAHYHRPPEKYPFDPRQRAARYFAGFPEGPPHTARPVGGAA